MADSYCEPSHGGGGGEQYGLNFDKLLQFHLVESSVVGGNPVYAGPLLCVSCTEYPSVCDSWMAAHVSFGNKYSVFLYRMLHLFCVLTSTGDWPPSSPERRFSQFFCFSCIPKKYIPPSFFLTKHQVFSSLFLFFPPTTVEYVTFFFSLTHWQIDGRATSAAVI